VDIEPRGPCKKITNTKTYACEVLPVREDVVFTILGRQHIQSVKSTFMLEKREGETGWAVSENFQHEYEDAISRSRLKSVTDAKEAP